MGQSFYHNVDDMGLMKKVIFGEVLTRLTGAFRGTDYDTKAMFRAITNSDVYQRQYRQGEKPGEGLHNADVNKRISVVGKNLLSRVLKEFPDDREAITGIYLRVLARRPTDRELSKCHAYIVKVESRAEACLALEINGHSDAQFDFLTCRAAGVVVSVFRC